MTGLKTEVIDNHFAVNVPIITQYADYPQELRPVSIDSENEEINVPVMKPFNSHNSEKVVDLLGSNPLFNTDNARTTISSIDDQSEKNIVTKTIVTGVLNKGFSK